MISEEYPAYLLEEVKSVGMGLGMLANSFPYGEFMADFEKLIFRPRHKEGGAPDKADEGISEQDMLVLTSLGWAIETEACQQQWYKYV